MSDGYFFVSTLEPTDPNEARPLLVNALGALEKQSAERIVPGSVVVGVVSKPEGTFPFAWALRV